MAAIVLVHGIDNHHLTADGIEADWLPALAGSVRLAGRPGLADRIWPPRTRPDSIDVRVAYYGDLFRTPDQMGAETTLRELSGTEADLAEALALEWLGRIATRLPADNPDAAQASFALEIARGGSGLELQGAGNVGRQVMQTLARHRWLARLGMRFAERFLISALTQVSRYLSEPALRAEARRRVLALIDADTRAVVAHSLGSVVAYECAHRLMTPLPLLVTLGCPLGLNTIVSDRVDPPPGFPPLVARWLNVADLDDVVAAEPDLAPRFAHDRPESARFEGVRVDNGSEPHRADYYLGRECVGRTVAEAIG